MTVVAIVVVGRVHIRRIHVEVVHVRIIVARRRPEVAVRALIVRRARVEVARQRSKVKTSSNFCKRHIVRTDAPPDISD